MRETLKISLEIVCDKCDKPLTISEHICGWINTGMGPACYRIYVDPHTCVSESVKE